MKHDDDTGQDWPRFWEILGWSAAIAAIVYMLTQVPEPYQRIGFFPMIGGALGYGMTMMMAADLARRLPPVVFAALGSAFAAATTNLTLGWIVFGLLGTSALVLFALEMSRSADR